MPGGVRGNIPVSTSGSAKVQVLGRAPNTVQLKNKGEKLMGISKLNLSEMAQGAFMEQFNNEMKKVLANIMDPNTDPTKIRKLTLTVSIKADEDRDVASFDVQTKSTLIPAKALGTKIIIDRDTDGSAVAAELKSGIKDQMYLDNDGTAKDDRGQVVSINKKENGGR